MYTTLLLLNALMAGTTTQPSVTITEIMYDPSSPERSGESEWIELMNTGQTVVDLSGWTIDDEDASDWGPLQGQLAPGEIAVIINADATTASEFHQAWSPDPSGDAPFLIIPVEWGSLDNQPSGVNEVLNLVDAHGKVACTANFQRGGEWPDPRGGGHSIHLTSLGPDHGASGSNWALTVSTTNGARTARTVGIFTHPDIGSPGVAVFAPRSADATPDRARKPRKVAPDAHKPPLAPVPSDSGDPAETDRPK